MTLTVWTGMPTKQDYFFHTSVPLPEVCTAVGFLYSDLTTLPNPTFGRVDVCKIWYPGQELITMDESPYCSDNEPFIEEVSCVAECSSGCLQCSTSFQCISCQNGLFVHSNGTCVPAASCDQSTFANSDTGRCDGQSL